MAAKQACCWSHAAPAKLHSDRSTGTKRRRERSAGKSSGSSRVV